MYELVILETISTSVFVIIRGIIIKLALELCLRRQSSPDNSFFLNVGIMAKRLIDLIVVHYREIILYTTLIKRLCLQGVRQLDDVPRSIII